MAIDREKVREKFRIVVRACLLTGVIVVSYFSGYGISLLLNLPNNSISGMWCAVTAIVVFDDLPTNALALMRDRLLGTFSGAFLSALFLDMFGHVMLSVCFALFCVCLCVIFFKWDGALKIACATVLIVGISAHNYTNREVWLFSGMRFMESVLGGLISLLATVSIVKSKSTMSRLKTLWQQIPSVNEKHLS